MSFRKTTIVLLVLLLTFNISLAQLEAFSAIDTADLRRHLSYIASDELQGRELGTDINGLDLCAEYLAKNAKIIGLLPGAPGYFQSFDLTSTKVKNNYTIEILNPKGKVLYHSKNLVLFRGNTKTNSLEDTSVCFVGFGNNLADGDFKNKIVCVAQGDISAYSKSGNYLWENELEQKKLERIAKAKPLAILLVTNPKDRKNRTFSKIKAWNGRKTYNIKPDTEVDEVPVFITLPEVADKILGSKYQKYLDRIIGKGELVTQTASGKLVSLKTEHDNTGSKVKNVIGVIEGSDPVLKKECIVFMAHYDHVGVNRKGEVFNGADDNGSGTVALLEVAEAFTKLKQKPARSIVFLWVTCEENGLLGSKYYTENPLFSLDKTIACINLDMVGRVSEERDSVFNRSPKKVKGFNGLYTLSNEIWPELDRLNATKCDEFNIQADTTLPSYFLRSSDHYHFHKNGVPILNYSTGYHADFHKTGDDVSKISFKKLKLVSELTFSIGLDIANYKNKD